MTRQTVNICFQDIGQLKEDVWNFIESWKRTVRAGDEVTLKVVAPVLGQRKYKEEK